MGQPPINAKIKSIMVTNPKNQSQHEDKQLRRFPMFWNVVTSNERENDLGVPAKSKEDQFIILHLSTMQLN